MAAPRTLSQQFVRASADLYLEIVICWLHETLCTYCGSRSVRIDCIVYEELIYIYGQFEGAFAANSSRRTTNSVQYCACTATGINIHMGGTNNQSAVPFHEWAVHVAHEYPTSVLGGLGEQGVCVVFFLHPNALTLVKSSSRGEISLEPRFVCCFCLFPGGGGISRYRYHS